jgi:hypothetical protein
MSAEMAKRKRKTSRAGKVNRLAAQSGRKDVKQTTRVEEDVDSAYGSLQGDGNTFQSEWTHNGLNGKAGKIDEGVKKSADGTPMILKLTESPKESIGSCAVGTCFEQLSPPITSADGSAVLEQTTQSENAKAETVGASYGKQIPHSEASKVATITISRLRVPTSLIRKPKSTIELLQDEVKSLKHSLEKKDRDLKSTRNQATAAARAGLELVKRKHDEELLGVREGLTSNHGHLIQELEYRYDDLKAKKGDVEAQREKATFDLRQLRQVHEKLRDEFKISQRNLETETAKFTKVKLEADALRAEKDRQSLTIGLLKSEKSDVVEKNRQLEEEVGSLKATFSDRSKIMAGYSTENLKLRDELFLVRSQGVLSPEKPVFNELGEWKTKYQKLLVQHKADKSDIEGLKRQMKGVDDERIRLRSIIEEKEKQLSKLGEVNQKQTKEIRQLSLKASEMKKKVSELKMEASELKKEVSELQKDRDLKAPMIQPTVNIRLRYLEYARETALGIPRAEGNRAMIINGNIAAHRGNGALDSAMFKAGLVPEHYLEKATKIFEHLYLVSPLEYGNWSPRTLRISDCRATLMTLKPANSFNQSVTERGEHDKILNRLIETLQSMTDEEIEASKEVAELVIRLEYLNDQIVERDRAKNFRPRPLYTLVCLLSIDS